MESLLRSSFFCIRVCEGLDEMAKGEVGEGEGRDQEERHGIGVSRAGVNEVYSEGPIVDIREGDGSAELREGIVKCAFCFTPGIFLEPI